MILPPLKIQGSKLKLLPLIEDYLPADFAFRRYNEPFLGSGVVALNIAKHQTALLSDINPHIIKIFTAIQKDRCLTMEVLKILLDIKYQYENNVSSKIYYSQRDKFNITGDPALFVVLSQLCFNGLVRFNVRGGFNSPDGKRLHRLTIKFIGDFIDRLLQLTDEIQNTNWTFQSVPYQNALKGTDANDFFYLDPPYAGRNTTYFNSTWNEEEFLDMIQSLPGKWMVSTWYSDKNGINPSIEKTWNKYRIVTQEHRYAIGPTGDNRPIVREALVMNYDE